MKFLLCTFLMFLQIAYAQETVTVVAVGEAEQDTDVISLIKGDGSKFNASQSKMIENFYKIIESDFSFYTQQFKFEGNVTSSESDLKSRFVILTKFTKNNDRFQLSLNVKDKVKGLILSENLDIDFTNIRAFSHDVSNKVYKSITGKESIFKTRILFVSDKTSTRKTMRKEIYIMDFDGENIERITHKNSIIISPVISPDNKKVLYSVIEDKWTKTSTGQINKTQNINLHLYDIETKAERMISNLNGINSGGIFNKTGDQIYLTISNQDNADIYKVDLKTLKKTKITSHFSDDVDPHINADESLMTFLSGRPGKAMIYTLDPTGLEKSVKRISFVGDFNAAPRFNPDGTEIVFSSWVDNRFDIYRIGSDGRNLVRLTKNFGSNEEPWYSPDGQFIVFTSQRVISSKKAVQDIYIMNREGEIIKKITGDFGKVYTPRWSNYM